MTAPLDWEEIEFRGGIEIHQQLDTRKLFCECPTGVRSEEPDLTTTRRLHAVASEMGEYDPAALHEARRARTFHYQSYFDSVCLVELDEEPPHPVNREALEICVQAGLMLDARMVDEIQVMRKTVIDGSNTAGFQRTMLVATDGVVETSEGPVNLMYFCLEEDAARIMHAGDQEVVYRLDRLGIPLLEIVTGPVFISPAQGGEVADRLGHLVRSLNVRRGIGSIRQDVNVSTKYGTRIEIKGVQRHRMVPAIMDCEARRQVNLWRIAEGLNSRIDPFEASDLAGRTADLTRLFERTEVKPLRGRLERGDVVIAIGVPGFRGLFGTELCPGKRLGTEMKEQVLTLGIRGIIHSDESRRDLGFREDEWEAVRSELGVGEEDAFLLFAAPPSLVDKALEKLHPRLAHCFLGVPKESRRAMGDGNSQYMRPLPGEARMYPETDIPPVVLSRAYLEEVRGELPEILEEKLERLTERFALPLHDLRKIAGYADVLERAAGEMDLDPSWTFNVLASNVTDVRRRTGVEPSPEDLDVLFRLVARRGLCREAVLPVLEEMAGGSTPEEAAEPYLETEVDLQEEVRRVVAENGEYAEHPKRFEILMGPLMERLRGKVEGARAARALREELEQAAAR
ncbi:MAG: Glu-tRNA(Gln) amidotransferase subunit GatE [bacterium]